MTLTYHGTTDTGWGKEKWKLYPIGFGGRLLCSVIPTLTNQKEDRGRLERIEKGTTAFTKGKEKRWGKKYLHEEDPSNWYMRIPHTLQLFIIILPQHYYIIGQVLCSWENAENYAELQNCWTELLNCRGYTMFSIFVSLLQKGWHVLYYKNSCWAEYQTPVGQRKDRQNKNHMVAKSCGKQSRFPNHLLAKDFSFSCSSASKSKALPISVTISALMWVGSVCVSGGCVK